MEPKHSSTTSAYQSVIEGMGEPPTKYTGKSSNFENDDLTKILMSCKTTLGEFPQNGLIP